MDKVTLAITLPVHGTAHDYQQAVSAAIYAQCDMTAQVALGNLLQHIHTSAPAQFNDSGAETTLVFGKF